MPEPTTDKLQNHSTGEIPYTSAEAATSPNILLPGLEHLEYDELFDRYQQSNFGLYHAKQTPRYAQRYTYDHSKTLTDLGDDVHPVEHMKYTHDAIAQPFVIDQAYELSPREVVVFRLGTFGHDIGECEYSELIEEGHEVVGDVAYGEKNNGAENKEQKIRRHILKKLWPEIPEDLLDEIDEMIMEPESKLGRMFNSVERLGYFETGLNAARVVRSELDTKRIEKICEQPYDKTRILQLSLLGSQVANIRGDLDRPFGQHYTELASRRDEYPYIDRRMGEIDKELAGEGRRNLSRLMALRADLDAMPYIESFDEEKYSIISN